MSIFDLSNWSWIKLTKWERCFFIGTCMCAILLWIPNSVLEFVCQDGVTRHQGVATKTGRIVGALFLLFLVSFLTCVFTRMIKVVKRMCMSWYESRQWKGKKAKKKILDLGIMAKKNIRAKYEYNKVLSLSETSSEFAELLTGNFIIPAVKADRIGAIRCELKPWVKDCFNKYPDLVKELPEFEEWEMF